MTSLVENYEQKDKNNKTNGESNEPSANGNNEQNNRHNHPVVDVLGDVLSNYEQRGRPTGQFTISLRSKAEDAIVRDAKQKQILMEICSQNLSLADWSGYSVDSLKGLQCLCLTGCNRVTDVSLQYNFKLPELREIRLGKCQQISIRGIAELVKNCRALEVINLSECHNINDKTIDLITRALPRLTKLYIERCLQLTDFSLDSITINCKNIREVDVRGCRGMSSEPNLRLSTVSTLRVVAMSKPGPYVTPILKNSMLPMPPPFPF